MFSLLTALILSSW